MRRVTGKVYAAFFPVSAEAAALVADAAARALGPEPPTVILEGTLLRISWEGIYFPLEEVLTALDAALSPVAEGKLDSIDLDAWTLSRYQRGKGAKQPLASTAVPRNLNHVLDYSGH